MLEARSLRKRYGAHLAVQSVSFDVHGGEVLGLLGPNGSGKTTTVNMIVGLLEPGGGSVSLDGCRLSEKPLEYKRRIGYVPEEPYLYTHLTAPEYLALVGQLRGMPRRLLDGKIARLLQLFLLHDSRYSAMSGYSKGMRQRVMLAAALMHDPDFLVLDEPFAGLDVSAGFLFRALLDLLASEGKMILFSSHRFDIVERVCSRAVILSHGRLVAEPRFDTRARTAESLEDVFVRVTEQDDYADVAREILGVIRDV
jgi:ABC-2 type transport system ATP-binding protein